MDCKSLSGASHSRKYGKVILTVLAVVIMVMAMGLTAFADGETQSIIDGVKNGMFELYRLLQGVTLPIATIFLVAQALRMVFGGQRSMDQAKTSIIILIVAIVVIWFAPTLVNMISSWFTGSTSWSFSTPSIS